MVQESQGRVVFAQGPHGWRQLLLGGDPFIRSAKKHVAAPDAVERAGKDGGWLLKKMIDADTRKFETKKEELIRKYRWVPTLQTASAE